MNEIKKGGIIRTVIGLVVGFFAGALIVSTHIVQFIVKMIGGSIAMKLSASEVTYINIEALANILELGVFVVVWWFIAKKIKGESVKIY
mgnify:FL=1